MGQQQSSVQQDGGGMTSLGDASRALGITLGVLLACLLAVRSVPSLGAAASAVGGIGGAAFVAWVLTVTLLFSAGAKSRASTDGDLQKHGTALTVAGSFAVALPLALGLYTLWKGGWSPAAAASSVGAGVLEHITSLMVVLLLGVPLLIALQLLGESAGLESATEESQQQLGTALAFAGCALLTVPLLWAFANDTTYLLPAATGLLALGVLPAALVTLGTTSVLASNMASRKGNASDGPHQTLVHRAGGLSFAPPLLLLCTILYSLREAPKSMSFVLLALLSAVALPTTLASAANATVALRGMADLRFSAAGGGGPRSP